MKMPKLALLVLVGFLSQAALAHEGHEQPGALPSAPHGGKVKEAAGGSKKGAESELFIEAVFEDPTLKLYPLTIDASGAFRALSPQKDLSKIGVEVEFPRSGKRNKLDVKLGSDSMESVVSTKGANRFLVIVQATHKGEVKKTKVQMELK